VEATAVGSRCCGLRFQHKSDRSSANCDRSVETSGRAGAFREARVARRGFVTRRAGERNRWTVSVNYRSAAGDSRKLPANSTLGRFHYGLVTEVGKKEGEKKRKEEEGRRRADPGRRGRHFGQITNGGTVAGAGEQPGFAASWLLRPIIRTNLIICLSSSPRLPPPRAALLARAP